MTLQELNNTPGFEKLSYGHQSQVRSIVAMQEAQAMPGFSNLSAKNQQVVVQAMTYQPPVLENVSEKDMELINLAEMYKAGDEGAGDALLQHLTLETVGNQMLVAQVYDKLLGREDGYFVNPELATREGRELNRRDRDKLNQYLEYTLNRDAQMASSLAKWKLIGTGVGVVADLATTWAIGGGLAKATGLAAKTGAFALGRNTSALASKLNAAGAATSRFGRWFGTKAVPEIIENSVFAAAQIGKDMLRDGVLMGLDEQADGVDIALNHTTKFGEYFLMDMAFFTGLQTLGIAGKLGFQMAKAPAAKVMQGVAKRVDDDVAQQIYKWSWVGHTPESFAKLDAAGKADYLSVRKRMETLKNIESIETDEDLVTYMLSSKGIDLQGPDITEAAGLTTPYRVVDVEKGTEFNFKTFNEAQTKASDILDARGDLPTPVGRDAQVMSDELLLKEKIQVEADAFRSDPEFIARTLTPDETGVLRTGNAEFGIRSLLRNTKMSEADVSGIRFQAVDDFYDVARVADDSPVFYLPKRVDNLTQQKRFEAYAFGKMRKLGKVSDEADDLIAQARRRFAGGVDEGLTPVWADRIGKKYGNVEYLDNGRIRFTDPTGEVVEYLNAVEMGTKMFTKYGMIGSGTDAFRYTQSSLRKNRGIILTKAKDGKLGVIEQIANRKVISKYKDLDSMLQTHPEWVPKMPSSQYPDFTIVGTESMPKIEFTRNMVTGTPFQLRNFSKDYSNIDLIPGKKISSTKEGHVAITGRQFEVVREDMGIVKRFNSGQEAAAYLKRGTKTLEDVRKFGYDKGLRVEYYNNQFLVHAGKDFQQVVPDLDSVKGVIKNAPDMPYLEKELAAFDSKYADRIQSELGLEIKDGKPVLQVDLREVQGKINSKYTGTVGFASAWARTAGTTGDFVRDASTRLGDTEMFRVYGTLEKGIKDHRAWSQRYRGYYHALVGSMNDAKARKVGQVLMQEGDPKEWGKAWQEIHQEAMPEWAEVTLERTREFLSGADGASGLIPVMGIDMYTAVSNYFPRIRKAYNDGVISEVGFRNWAKTEFNGRIPKELNYWAENERILGEDDILNLINEDNIYKVIDTYIDRGFRKKFLQPGIDEANVWIDGFKAKGVTEENKLALDGMIMYVNEVAGKDAMQDITSTKGLFKAFATSLEEMLHKNLKVPGPKAKKIAQNAEKLYGSAGGVMINNLMSFRGWLPIRNSLQPFVSFAPWVGMDAVTEAYEYVAKHYDDAKRVLEQTGRRAEISPIQQLVQDGRRAFPVLEKLNAVGMSAYSESDIITRLVVDRAIRKGFDDNVSAFQRGIITQKEFMRRAYIDKMDLQDQKVVLEMLQDNYLGAVEKAGDYWTDLTMFSYHKADNPTVTKGFLGKLFGSFGTYPIHMVANMTRMVTKNSGPAGVAQAVLTAGAWVAGSKLLFEKLLGIDADAFQIWGNIGFSGGPQYQFVQTALTAVSGTEYEKKSARGQLLREFETLFVPGSRAAKTAQDIMDAVNQNDYGRVMRSALTAPEVR